MGGVFNHINCDLYHYAGNNPVKYTDPDGNETYDSSITEDQYKNSWLLQKDRSWESVQKFFEENPNGVLHRPEQQFAFMELEDKNEIVDPNACNVDLVKIIAGVKFFSKHINFKKKNGEIPDGKWRINRKDGTSAEIHSGHTHYDKATGKDEPLHTHELKPRDPRDPKYGSEPLYKDKDAHKTTGDEIRLYWEQYKK